MRQRLRIDRVIELISCGGVITSFAGVLEGRENS